MGIVAEEADETLFWLELIQEMGVMKDELLKTIMKENNEIISIVVSSIKTAKQRRLKSKDSLKSKNQKSEITNDR